jgi:hypothetical protein
MFAVLPKKVILSGVAASRREAADPLRMTKLQTL